MIRPANAPPIIDNTTKASGGSGGKKPQSEKSDSTAEGKYFPSVNSAENTNKNLSIDERLKRAKEINERLEIPHKDISEISYQELQQRCELREAYRAIENQREKPSFFSWLLG